MFTANSRSGRHVGALQISLRLFVALIVALLSVPLLSSSVFAEGAGKSSERQKQEQVSAEPTAEEPLAEEPVVEEPAVEEPAAEEPAVEPEPAAEPEQPAEEAAQPEEPAAEEASAEQAPAESQAGGVQKVVVCKYVLTPGVPEKLDHIIVVAPSAIPEWSGTFPDTFADAHERSYALRWAEEGEQAHDIALTACPSAEEPPGEDPPGEEDPKKVVVCKYVRTPGTGEVLSHIIIVNQSAIPGWDGTTFPFEFADEHGQSMAIRWALDKEQAKDVPLTACPGVPTTTLVIEKQDFETGEVLGGATFALYEDNVPFADPTDPVVGAEDLLIATDTTDSNGLAKFAERQEGHYLVVETLAPEGYELPEQDTIAVVIDDGNFVAGGEMAAIVFQDFALGQLAIVAKRQFELIDGEWVESDGVADFGDVVKYVVEVSATGPKIFHDVQVLDYVPGFNPDDDTSTVQATLVPGSAVCTGSLECEVTVGADGLVTWSAGTVHDAAGTAEMVVRFPDLPDDIVFDEDGVYTATLWNVGYLRWQEVTGGTAPVARGRLAMGASAFEFTEHELTSNEVVISASVEQGAPIIDPPGGPTLPDTGAPSFLGGLALLGGLTLASGVIVLTRGRRGVGVPV